MTLRHPSSYAAGTHPPPDFSVHDSPHGNYAAGNAGPLLPSPEAMALIPRHVAQRHLLLPLALNETDKRLTLAISDPDNIIALDQVRALVGGEYRVALQTAAPSDILDAINRHYGLESPLESLLREIGMKDTEPGVTPSSGDSAQPVVRLVDALLADAVRLNASDIHFEPESGSLRIRCRIDGILRQIHSLSRSLWPAMSVRLKVMGNMDIAETRAPQDGRISLRLCGRPIDFRAATHPTEHGENMVLRILDRQKGIVPLDRIGLEDGTLRELRHLVSRPEGIVLATGPTGSGKTTTLYSILCHLNTEAVNIMTLEDPVEYPLPSIRQTAAGEATKLDFSSGIRSILRQDPDIVLVGEIRDHPTAEMAFRAAMTGHQVYSTLHANSALGAIPRLTDIGILPDIVAANLIGVIAQRLVRTLCPHCRQPCPAGADERNLLDARDEQLTLYRPAGCPRCNGQGYSGRIAIMELLGIDADLGDLIARRASMSELKRTAREKGFRPLAQDGLKRVRQGMTTLAEVARVVDMTEYRH